MEDNKDYLFRDFPEFKVTKETRKNVVENPQNYSNYDVKIRMGKFYTDEEYQRKIDDGLSRELPGQKKLCKRITKKNNERYKNKKLGIAFKIVTYTNDTPKFRSLYII